MYDHIRFYTEEGYPENLPPENAATHIGMYWQWAAQAELANPVWQAVPETVTDFAVMIGSRFSGAQFLFERMDGALTPDDFNPFGQGFTSYCYDDKEEGYSAFTEDYVHTLGAPSLGDFCYVEDSSKTYTKLAPVFQMASEK